MTGSRRAMLGGCYSGWDAAPTCTAITHDCSTPHKATQLGHPMSHPHQNAFARIILKAPRGHIFRSWFWALCLIGARLRGGVCILSRFCNQYNLSVKEINNASLLKSSIVSELSIKSVIRTTVPKHPALTSFRAKERRRSASLTLYYCVMKPTAEHFPSAAWGSMGAKWVFLPIYNWVSILPVLRKIS